MYLLDSDLRGPLADYTFHHRCQPTGSQPPSSDEADRAKRSNWAARTLGAMAPRIFGKTRMGGATR
jgi:hypothetical protein